MTAMFAPLLDSAVLFARGGAGAHVPANTLESFQLGLRLGATGINGDIWLTADGQAVFNSGPTVGPRLRRKPIAGLERDALPGTLVDVGQLLEACGETFSLSVELRDASAFEAVVSAVQERGAGERLWVSHADMDLLAGWQRTHPDITYIHATSIPDLERGPEHHAAQLRERAIDGVSLPHAEWTAGHVAVFHRFSRLTVGWLPEHERHIVGLLEMGIDAVVSEQAERMSDAARIGLA